jgi:formylglycine-generating enzyme required for sulfatase activity
MEWRIACWNTENLERMKRMEKDKDAVRRMGWTRNNTPRTPKAGGSGSYIRQEVCTRKPNSLGFFDMCGLVSEWCQDSLIGRDDLYEVSATCLPYFNIHLIGRKPWSWDAPWSGGIRILVEEE